MSRQKTSDFISQWLLFDSSFLVLLLLYYIYCPVGRESFILKMLTKEVVLELKGPFCHFNYQDWF